MRKRPTIAAEVLDAARELSRALGAVSFGGAVRYVYDPLTYAWEPYRRYVERYGRTPKRVLVLGMNPGPFGMAQTGVPFGEVRLVRDWLGIEGAVGHPARECPSRPVQGFACPRSEVSGARLWGAIRDRYGEPERFFAERFVANYCPLLFLDGNGRNITPDKLPRDSRDALRRCCDRHLRRVVVALAPQWVVGVGQFAEGVAREALGEQRVRIGRILHPSPASPRANAGWAAQAHRELAAQGVCR